MVKESHACTGVSQPLWHLHERCVRGLIWHNTSFAFGGCYFNLMSCLSSRWGNTVRLLLISDSQRGCCVTSKSFSPIGDSWQLLKVLFCALMEEERKNLPVLRKSWQVMEQHKTRLCANKVLSSEY